MAAEPSTTAKLKKIREAYLKQLPAQLEGIRDKLQVLHPTAPSTADVEDLHRSFHNMKGASACFGLLKVAAEADVGERLAEKAEIGEAAWRGQMETQLVKLAEEIAAINPLELSDPRVEQMPVAEKRSQSDGARKVFLCEEREGE